MNPTREIAIISADAGDRVALQDPNSPASIMKKAKVQETQSAADMKYDAQAPTRVESFENCVVDFDTGQSNRQAESLHSLLLATSVLLLVYAVAPDSL